MAKKVAMSKERLETILSELDIGPCTYSAETISRNLEEDVDDEVKRVLKTSFDEKFVVGKKTGNKVIDDNVPPYHGDSGKGKPDVMVYNYFGKNEIDVIVEDKNFTSHENALEQAKVYATIGNHKDVKQPVRVVIGNSPSKQLEVRVLVKGKYEPLKINGITINSFFGKSVLKLIYDNPDCNEFVLEENVEKPFSQKDFSNIINKLKQYYRQITELGNNDDVSINFTVAFIALKMIIEKQGQKWNELDTNDKILSAVENIVGDSCDDELSEKYGDIFVIKDEKTKNVVFNFQEILTLINIRQKKDRLKTSQIMAMHAILSAIPEGDHPIDLFGEVYEALASKKTKSALGEFFTRRHIIQAIVRLFLSEDDIRNIVENRCKIADPACGTGGFLTESFKYIKAYCEKEHPDMDISELASQIMVGYDINPNNVGRTRINMTLAGDGFSDIRTQNSLTSTNYAHGIKYILTNVPYGTKGDYAISDVNSNEEFIKSNNNKRLELNFMLKIIEMLDKGGKASVIVPEGLLEAPTLSPFRDYMLRYCKLNAIISLPKFAFAPYTKWKTYVIFIEKRNKPLVSIEDINENEKTWCYIVDNDGYANSDKRFPTKLINKDGSWKHDELSQYKDVDGVIQSSKIEKARDAEEDEEQSYTNEWGEVIVGKKYGFIKMKDIKQKRTIKHNTLSAADVNGKLKTEANSQAILDDNTHKQFTDMLTQDKKGAYKVTKEDYMSDDELKDEFVEIFALMDIEYNSDENKFYDLSNEQTIYALPLIPEKYFRKKDVDPIDYDGLKTKVDYIEQELKNLFGGA